MIYLALGIFSLVAILGMLLLTYILTNKETPKGLAIIHGGFGALAILLLIFYVFFHWPTAIESVLLFVMAAFMGFILVRKDIKGVGIPKWLAVTHGLTAVLGFGFLIYIILSH